MRCFFTFLFLIAALTSHGQYGTLDPSFAVNGVATGGFSGFDNRPNALVVQPDGKILLAGDIDFDDGVTYTREMALTRYNPDGSVDLTFGNNGSDTTFFSQANNSCTSINLLPDGKILLGGMAEGHLALVQYLSNGSPDLTFGTNGVATFNIFTDGFGVSVKRSNNGSIYITCPTPNGIGSGVSYLILRSDSIGRIDHTFGNNGLAQIGDRQNNLHCATFDVLCDGSILVIGATADHFAFATMHVNSDGSLDRNFGANGIASNAFSNILEAIPTSIAVKHDGRIVVAGSLIFKNQPGYYGYALAQYTSDGKPDYSFGGSGSLIGNFQSNSVEMEPEVITLQADEKILVSSGYGEYGRSALARWNTDGTPDYSFGNQGQSAFMNGTATCVAIQPDGKIIQAGYTWFPFRTLLMRYTSDIGIGPIDTCPPPTHWVMPTAFSPNGDSLNNTYYIIADGPLKSFTMHISNRWGETIFSSTDINEHWDGNYHGKEQPEGMYFCSVCTEDYDGNRSCRSSIINLIR